MSSQPNALCQKNIFLFCTLILIDYNTIHQQFIANKKKKLLEFTLYFIFIRRTNCFIVITRLIIYLCKRQTNIIITSIPDLLVYVHLLQNLCHRSAITQVLSGLTGNVNVERVQLQRKQYIYIIL